MFDPSKKKTGRRRVSYSEARLAAIVDCSFDAIISKDLEGTIVSWNRSAEQLFGFIAEEAIGRSIYILIPDDRHAEEVDIIRRLKRGERIETFETVRRTRSGELKSVSITISPIKNRRGRIVGGSKIARDISDTKERERRLQLLMREINHRVRNQYAVILSIIAQTAQREPEVRNFEKRIRERIMALSHSHDLLAAVDWGGVDLGALLAQQVQPHNTAGAFSLSGPALNLDANAVLHIGMAVHELIMNRARFSNQSIVAVDWGIVDDAAGMPVKFRMIWRERGAMNEDLLSQGNGFGSLVLKRIVGASLGGVTDWTAGDGVITWTLTAPVANLQVNTAT